MKQRQLIIIGALAYGEVADRHKSDPGFFDKVTKQASELRKNFEKHCSRFPLGEFYRFSAPDANNDCSATAVGLMSPAMKPIGSHIDSFFLHDNDANNQLARIERWARGDTTLLFVPTSVGRQVYEAALKRFKIDTHTLWLTSDEDKYGGQAFYINLESGSGGMVGASEVLIPADL
jgi:hypothetical protein